jgi:predicted nucleic acid-binding protein
MIVVDASALIAFLRGSPTPAASKLAELEQHGVPFAVPAICAQEVLQGARDAREWRVLERYLQGQSLLVPSDPWSTHAAAASIFVDCRRKGVSLRGTVDCLVAAMTLERDGVLLHEDRDFEKMKVVRPLRTMPELP